MIVSLTLTPMMCARLLTPEQAATRVQLSQALERFFDALVAVYDRGAGRRAAASPDHADDHAR